MILLTLATNIVKRKISGEICISHFLESLITDFAAANRMLPLSEWLQNRSIKNDPQLNSWIRNYSKSNE